MERKPLSPSYIGIQILRVYMCFLVISTHINSSPLFHLGGLFYTFQAYHVPVFMLLSFVLCGKYFLDPSKEGIVKRTLRLLIPFVVWGIVSFLFELILYRMDITTLLWQLSTGLPVNVSLWYLIILFWISIVFWTIRMISNKKVFLIIITALAVFCIVSQYTGLNLLIFSNAHYNIQKSFGRMAEMIPLSVVGIWISLLVPYINKLEKKHHVIIFVSSLVVLSLLTFLKWKFDIDHFRGQDYNGLLLIGVSLLLVLTAFTNPLNFIKNEKFCCVIKWMSKYTMGIFCIHIVLGLFLEWGMGYISGPTHNFFFALILYALSYLVSFFISLIPNKYTKMLVE